MTVPPSPTACWSELETDAKRVRLLRAAGEVFAREGLDAPMPAVAAAAGAGIGSVYRQFPSKRDLLAALVVERLLEVTSDADAALAHPDGPWPGLTDLLRAVAAAQGSDSVLAEAMATVSAHPGVRSALAANVASLERLVAAAKAEGDMRADATALDVRLIFASTRAARGLEGEAWERMLELGIDSLTADARRPGGR